MRFVLLLVLPLFCSACIELHERPDPPPARDDRRPVPAPQDGNQGAHINEPPADRSRHDPSVEVALAFSADAAWVLSRTHIRGGGYVDLGFLANDDSDIALNLGLLRIDRVIEDVPLTVGVGFGLYGIFLDESDVEAAALPLTGLISYDLDTSMPVRLGAQLSLAPDITTYGDGDSMLDVITGVEIGVGRFGSAVVGYRFFELELDGGGDHTLEEGLYLGVRLGF